MDNDLRIENLHFEIGDIIDLDCIDYDIGELGLEYIFDENEVFNLQVGHHKKIERVIGENYENQKKNKFYIGANINNCNFLQ